MNMDDFLRVLIMVFLISICSSVFSQYDRSRYEEKLEKYKKIQRNGIIIGITGLLVCPAGITAFGIYTDGNFYAENDLVGTLILSAGMMGFACIPTGLITYKYGKLKKKRYEQILNKISIYPTINSLYLTYRF